MNERLRCKLCGLEGLVKETDSFTLCNFCGTLSRTNPDDEVAVEFPDDMYFHEILPSERRWMQMIENHSVNKSRKTLLDLACGNGSFLMHANDCGWTVRGIEENPHLARAGKERGLEIEECNLDIFDWPEQWCFDVIRIWFALEHVEQPGKLIRSASEHLNAGGLLAIAIPNDAGWLAHKLMRDREDRFWEHPLHLHHYPPHGLERWIESFGYERLIAEADRPTELMRYGNLPLKQAWDKARECAPELSRIFYQLGVGRTREMLFRKP